MDLTPLAVGLTLTSLGCACVYLASPRQLLLARAAAPPATGLRAAGGGLAAAGLVALTRALLPLPALVAWAVWGMVVLIALPHLTAVLAARAGEA